MKQAQRANQGNWNRDRRNEGGHRSFEEQKNHQHHQGHCERQGELHIMN